MTKPAIEKFTTSCSDGVELRGLLIVPDSPKAVVQFNCGTAAKKEFYQPFLEYLADHSYVCCLWDYRGSGDSAPTSLKGCEHTFSDYGQKDMPAIKDYLSKKYQNLPLFIVAHSAGAQQIGFIENSSDIKAMVSIAVSAGYLPSMPLSYRVLSYYFFYLFTPISNALVGYVKAKPFGYMENLPKNVALEWRNWCSKKDYLFDEKFYGKTVPKGHFNKMTFPIHMFSVTDDNICSEQNIRNFWKHIKSEHEIGFTRISPKEIEAKEVGHMGFFRKRFKESLWPLALNKLEEYYHGL